MTHKLHARMADNGIENGPTLKPVQTILISQPKPERSPFFALADKHNVQIDWRSFIHVEGLSDKEFRKNRVYPNDYSAVIFTSKNSIDHFFRLCEDMRISMSGETKWFCKSEVVSNYLQNFIIYRKRKVFAGQRTFKDLQPYLLKHRKNERFFLPNSNLGAKELTNFLDENEFEYADAMMYRTVASDLSDLSDVKYDILVFYSPLGIKSLYENFPDFEQGETRIAVFGNSTARAVEAAGLTINIQAPTPGTPSMTMAIEKYVKEANKLNI